MRTLRMTVGGVLFLFAIGVLGAHAFVENAVGIWLFDEGAGDVATDSSGNDNHGDIKGAEWTNGKFGGALQFNGTNAYVEVPDSPSLDLEDAVTMIGWFYWEGSGDAWQTLFSKGPFSGINENYALFINSARYFHFVINPGARQTFDSPGDAFDTNTWHHVAATWDGSRQEIYLDGELIAERQMSGTLMPVDNYLGIGIRQDSPHWWNGMLDEMAVFNVALSEAEIRSIMNDGLDSALSVSPKAKAATTWGALKRAR